jgi:hypothetical protein
MMPHGICHALGTGIEWFQRGEEYSSAIFKIGR